MSRAKAKILNDDEIQKLRRFFNNYGDKDFLLSMIELLFYTGLRPKELTTIELGDLMPFEERVALRNPCKNGERRLIPAPSFLLLRLKDMALDSGLRSNNSLFNVYGQSEGAFMKAIVTRWCSVRLKVWGYGSNYGLYSFRHTKAKDVYERSQKNISAVQMLLGHKSIASTMHYLKEISYEDYVKLYITW